MHYLASSKHDTTFFDKESALWTKQWTDCQKKNPHIIRGKVKQVDFPALIFIKIKKQNGNIRDHKQKTSHRTDDMPHVRDTHCNMHAFCKQICNKKSVDQNAWPESSSMKAAHSGHSKNSDHGYDRKYHICNCQRLHPVQPPDKEQMPH